MLYPHEPNTIILYFYIYDFNILNHLAMVYSKHVCIPACTFCIKSKTIRVERSVFPKKSVTILLNITIFVTATLINIGIRYIKNPEDYRITEAFRIIISWRGRSLLPLSVTTFWIFSTTSIPSSTSPKTV